MAEKQKLVRVVGKNRIEVSEEELPEVKADSILIKVELSGICGTDLHILENADSERFKGKLPMTPGHEVTGTIVRIGSKANEAMICGPSLKEGDRIVIYVFLPCNN